MGIIILNGTDSLKSYFEYKLCELQIEKEYLETNLKHIQLEKEVM